MESDSFSGTLSPEQLQLLALMMEEEGFDPVDEDSIPRREGTGPAPLSFGQQRLWFIHQLDPRSAAYNVPLGLRLRGGLDRGTLELTLTEIARRHESLRTTLEVEGAEPVQVIHPPSPVAVEEVDLSTLPAGEREAAAERLAAEEAARPFDLRTGPLFRAMLLRLGGDQSVLLFTMHHVVSDGWSLGVLVAELSELYGALAKGREARLPELPVQYADYAVWQREHLSGEALEGQVGYWRERLAGAPPVLEIPTDRPRTATQGAEAARIAWTFPAGAAEALRALSRREGTTLYMTLLAAFQALLARYARQDDVSVGTPVAGRTRSELEGLIGFFVNTLVIRTDLSGSERLTFRELLGRVREGVLEAQAHQDLPFERLVEALGVERSLTQSPLFQVLFTLQEASLHAAPRIGGVEAEVLDREPSVAQFDLSLTLVDDTPLRGWATYRTALFDAATVERMLVHLGTLLERVAADPDAPLSTLSLLDADERERLVRGWNATGRDYPAAGRPLHALVEAQVRRTPERTALVFEGERLSYAELDARANRLARHLRALGVGAETRVGVCVERSLEMVVALLAVLKAGGAYVPLDPGYPAERLAYMLEDSAVPVLLTQARLAGALPAHGARTVLLDAEWERIAAESPEPLGVETDPDALAYMIYTSGSTGRPKGAMNAHRGIVNRLLWMQEEYGLGEHDVVLQKTPFSFDVSVWEFFWPLIAGARLVVARPEGHRDPRYLAETIEGEGVTTLHFVPPMLQAFLEATEEGRCGGIRRVVCSGEALPFELQERFFARFPAAELHNLYGPTEAAVDVTYQACRPGEPVTIGRPVANTRVYLLDETGEPVPVGVPGELHIGGVQVGRGYLGRPELTAEKFVPDPFGEPGARLYRTGDLARWRADGTVAYLGRVDFQVKLRGFRIELGEIEAALREQPGVREAMVLVREDHPGEQRLVGYLTGEGNAEEVRARLRQRLPEHMVPSALVALEAFPLTPNGKVDRRALPAPEPPRPGTASQRAARTPTEEVVAAIWADLLRLDHAGPDDDFFALGGHSLLATQVVSRLRQAFGVELPLRALFEDGTVAGVARRVEDALGARAELAAPPLVPVPRERGEGLPLSFSQERLWFLTRLDPAYASYNIAAGVRMTGALDAETLRRSLEEVVHRHESLRTVFAVAGDESVQRVLPPAAFPLPLEDVSALPAEERETAMLRLGDREAGHACDLQRGPLFRARLVRLAEEEHVLLLALHHVVGDAWSLGVLTREVAALYPALAAGEASPLPPLPVQYADYAVWQRRWLRGDALRHQLDYWTAQLGGAPALLELPTDRPRPPVQTHRAAEHVFAVPAETAGRLVAMGRSEGVTLFMTLLAAWQLLLARYSGQEDVVVGTPIAGRTREETEGLIGFFVNQLALRTDLSGNPSFRELLGRVRETTLGAYAHQDVPFEKLLEELEVERSLSHALVYQTMLILHNARAELAPLPGVEMAPVRIGSPSAVVDLEVSVRETPAGLAGAVVYAADLFDASTVAAMVEHLKAILEAVAADPGRRVAGIPLLTAAEREVQLVDWNRTGREFPAGRTAHELFAEQARRTPDAPAVAFDGEWLTYAELDARAERLAGFLRARGAGPERRVAVCMERATDMLVAVLGVLKSGAAYVPLDPANPRERLERVVRDSGALALLTQERLRAAVPSGEVETVALDAEWERIEAEGGVAPPAAAGPAPEGLAYLIYTSGSTGTPKGVMVTHRSLVNYADAARAEYGIGADDRVLQFASLSFDASAEEIFPALFGGAALVLRTPDMLDGVAVFLARVEEWGVTVLDLPTAFWHEVAAELERGSARLPACVRLVIIGGERALPERVAGWRAAVGDRVRLVNTYGPTETTIVATAAELRAAEATVPIGRPVANARAYVLDREMEPVPQGVRGELCVGGAGVARGYLGDPARTAEKFVPDPFAGEPGARLYRTGDLARWLPDGELEFVGRSDGQVKVRGFRVELGDIEAALARHEGVREAVVVAREDAPGRTRLVVYVVPADPDAEGEEPEAVPADVPALPGLPVEVAAEMAPQPEPLAPPAPAPAAVEVPVLEFPTDRPRVGAAPRAAELEFAVPPEVARRPGAPEVPLLAAFHALLARYTAQDEVVAGFASPGADGVRLVRGAPRGALTAREWLDRTRMALEGATPEAAALEIVERPGLARVPRLVLGGAAPDDEGGRPELTLRFREADGGLAGTALYDAALFDATTVERMAAHFAVLL
ncbi:MAG: amino acid adenylation domain-containing protein, partial [Gemmatimonadetes bacterium]|nr:amino acid adenylation domain-containing protein [Gemmatimonadota bacterium]